MGMMTQQDADLSNARAAPRPGEIDTLEPAGFWESAGDSLQAGLMTTGTAAWQLATVPAIGADWVKSKATGVETTEQQDLMFSNIIDPAVQYVDSLSHRERTMAGSLSFGIGKVLTEFAGGGAPSMAVAEFSGRSTSEVRGGNSVMDANMLALNQAAWAYAGARLPGALGGSLSTKIASGAGINVVAGVGQRATEYGLMTMQGDARAADISVFGFQDMLVDAVLGAAFGPLDSARTKGMDMPDGKAIDGAMLMDRARFEDVQVGVRAPEVLAQVDRGIAENIRAMQEGRPALVERLPDEVTMPQRIVAYHGTPHEFDSFSLQNIGTGEGNQSFGWGLYFAKSKKVAETYRESLSDFDLLVNGSPFDETDAGHRVAVKMLDYDQGAADGGSRQDAIDRLVRSINDMRSRGKKWADELANDQQAELDLLMSDEPIQTATHKSKGRLYEVDLGFTDEQALDWDKPLSEQTETVRAAIPGIVASVKKSFPAFNESSATGKGLYTAYQAHRGGDAETASRALHSAGIAGIKYLDGASRIDGEGTHNYVAFDDSSVRILPDPDMKAMQAEITTLRDSQIDLSQPIVPDVDPATVAELRAQAQAIEAERGAANDPDVAEATAFADRVKSIRDVMGCLLRIGA